MLQLEETRQRFLEFLSGDAPAGRAFWLYGLAGFVVLHFVVGYPVMILINLIFRPDWYTMYELTVGLHILLWVFLSILIWRCAKKSPILIKWLTRIVYVGFGAYLWSAFSITLYKAIDSDTDYKARNLFIKASNQLEKNNLDAAVDIFDEIIALMPNDYKVARLIASTIDGECLVKHADGNDELLNDGAYDEAIRFYQIALKIHAEKGGDQMALGEIYDGLGDTYASMGNNESAIEFLKKSLKIYDESDGDHEVSIKLILNRLGDCSEKLGQSDEAKEYRKRAAELDKLRQLRQAQVTPEMFRETISQWTALMERYDKDKNNPELRREIEEFRKKSSDIFDAPIMNLNQMVEETQTSTSEK